MKKHMNRALCVLYIVIVIIIAIAIIDPGAYAEDAAAESVEAVRTVLIENPESIYIDMNSDINTVVKTWDEDISISVETRGAENGYITVSYDDTYSARAKVLVMKDAEQYLYTISSGSVNLPLQMGNGEYSITVYRMPENSKYTRMTKITLMVDGLRDEDVYINSIQMVDYEGYKDVVDELNKLLVNANSDEEKIKTIYNHIINSFRYSNEKAESIRFSTTYLPDLRDFMDTKAGVCYDYASLFAAVLRSNGIPVKLIKGFRIDIKAYHAWNEVWLDGKWVIIDTIYDAGIVQDGKTTGMIKDASSYNQTMKY